MRTCQIFELRAPVKQPGKKSARDPWGDKSFPAGMFLSVITGASGTFMFAVGKPAMPIDDIRAKALMDACGPPTKPVELATLFELHGFGGDVIDEAFTCLRAHYPNEIDWLSRALAGFATHKLSGLPDMPADPPQG